jgi:hypothetical protein
MFQHLRWMAVVVLVAACGSATPTSAPVSAPPASESAPGASGAAIQLQAAPANLGCDTIGVDYREVTFKIDPAAAEPVVAIANTGLDLHTFWAAGFRGGTADNKVVFDPTGAVVVTDGDKLAIPEGAFPRLNGYFVCPSPDALYVLAADPQ